MKYFNKNQLADFNSQPHLIMILFYKFYPFHYDMNRFTNYYSRYYSTHLKYNHNWQFSLSFYWIYLAQYYLYFNRFNFDHVSLDFIKLSFKH